MFGHLPPKKGINGQRSPIIGVRLDCTTWFTGINLWFISFMFIKAWLHIQLGVADCPVPRRTRRGTTTNSSWAEMTADSQPSWASFNNYPRLSTTKKPSYDAFYADSKIESRIRSVVCVAARSRLWLHVELASTTDPSSISHRRRISCRWSRDRRRSSCMWSQAFRSMVGTTQLLVVLIV